MVESLDTSGRAVLFAGITVCIALLGMFALGVSFLYGVAVAAAIAVAFTVLAALTLLPALLGFFGPRRPAPRERRALARAAGCAEATSRRPGRAGPGLVQRARRCSPPSPRRRDADDRGPVLLDAPGLRRPGQRSRPTTTTRKAYDLLAKGFGPGFNGPLQLVAQVTASGRRRLRRSVARGGEDAEACVGHAPPRSSPARDGRPPWRSPTSTPGLAAGRLDHRPRAPPARPRRSPPPPRHRAKVLVGGQTAIFDDFSHVLSRQAAAVHRRRRAAVASCC